MITIREVEATDAAAVTLLSHQLGYTISEAQTIENIRLIKESRHHGAYVVQENEQVVGWIGVAYNLSLESAPIAEVRGLVVHENFRGRGIGKMLIDRAKEWCLTMGSSRLRLRCNLRRTEAQSFYESVGFTRVKQQQVFELRMKDDGM